MQVPRLHIVKPIFICGITWIISEKFGFRIPTSSLEFPRIDMEVLGDVVFPGEPEVVRWT